MKRFKLVYGYGEADYIPIVGDELHKAFALKISQNGDGYFENGMIRAQDIRMIVPDWHAHFGWNRGYKMVAEDYGLIEGIDKEYKFAMNKAKEIAEYVLETKNYELLKLSATQAIQKLPEKNEVQKFVGDGVKHLADKMSMR